MLDFLDKQNASLWFPNSSNEADRQRMLSEMERVCDLQHGQGVKIIWEIVGKFLGGQKESFLRQDHDLLHRIVLAGNFEPSMLEIQSFARVLKRFPKLWCYQLLIFGADRKELFSEMGSILGLQGEFI